MHELSLAEGILKLVDDARQREGFARVKTLHLEAGALSGVEVRALRFALDALTPDTCADGAQIVIDEPAAQAWCLGCNQSVAIRSRVDLCPSCGSARLHPTGGTELRVVDLLVEDAANAPAPAPRAEPTL